MTIRIDAIEENGELFFNVVDTSSSGEKLITKIIMDHWLENQIQTHLEEHKKEFIENFEEKFGNRIDVLVRDSEILKTEIVQLRQQLKEKDERLKHFQETETRFKTHLISKHLNSKPSLLKKPLEFLEELNEQIDLDFEKKQSGIPQIKKEISNGGLNRGNINEIEEEEGTWLQK